jgi:hypothetical protein
MTNTFHGTRGKVDAVDIVILELLKEFTDKRIAHRSAYLYSNYLHLFPPDFKRQSLIGKLAKLEKYGLCFKVYTEAEQEKMLWGDIPKANWAITKEGKDFLASRAIDINP